MSLLSEFSIQLYSLRDAAAKDFPAVLRFVSKLGYTGVEFAGYGGLSAGEMKTLLDECGLKPVGTHVSIERLTEALDEELAYNKAIGTGAIVVPYYPIETEKDVRELAAKLCELAPKVRAAGFGFAYHNHGEEFAAPNGRYLLDLLLELVPADLLSLELDIYWAAYADVDYKEYMLKNAGRVNMLHIKQMADPESKTCVDLPDGVIDFGDLIRAALSIGVEQFILEQEEFAVSGEISVKRDIEYIMNL